jgi:hypothetical protein
MATAVLLLFVLMLVGFLVLAFRYSALAVPLGIMTYAYKQIASLALPFLQTQGALFNYMMAGAIGSIFMYNLVFKSPVGCRTRDGKIIIILVWIFLGLFWVSSLWSPFYGNDSWKFFPYFVVYFWMLPLLIGRPVSMLMAFGKVWYLTFVGGLALLLSPHFHLSNDLGRMVVHFQAGRFNEASPLAIADMGAYLLLMSVLVFLAKNRVESDQSYKKYFIVFQMVIGLALSLWLVFNTSRGETFAGIFCACLLVGLVMGKNVKQYVLWTTGLISVVVITVMIVFTILLPKGGISKWSERYSSAAITEGSADRKNLNSRTLEFATSSPGKFIFGIGARGCEKRLGMYPHNNFIQAIGEIGLLGLSLLCLCYGLAFRFGFRTLAMARKFADEHSVVFTAFMLTLLIYQFFVLSKKGSLTFVDTYMWLAMAVFCFDRTQTMLLTQPLDFSESRETDAVQV